MSALGIHFVRSQVEALQERVRRAAASRSRPMVGTMRTAKADSQHWPQMPDAEYAALVAREGKQAWTPDDEQALRDKARRIRGR